MSENEWGEQQSLLVDALTENHRLRRVIELYEKYIALLDALEEFEGEKVE